MNISNRKQKAFAQRVYFDLKICRKWTKLNVYFDEIHQWIFFVGKNTDDQRLTFVLPISSDEQLTVDQLFNLRLNLSQAWKDHTGEEIQNILMAIIANDFTLGYFNFTNGLPKSISSESKSIDSISSPVENECIKEINTTEWDMEANWN